MDLKKEIIKAEIDPVLKEKILKVFDRLSKSDKKKIKEALIGKNYAKYAIKEIKKTSKQAYKEPRESIESKIGVDLTNKDSVE